MANKRMFSLEVIDTDIFLEMPLSSRLLYYELGMRADDDGFVDNWKKIIKMTGLAEDDMKILIAKEFIIPFDNGVIVIKHWRLNNYLRNDRHHPTRHKAELAQLYINDDVYELETTGKSTMLPTDSQAVYLDKSSIDKNSIDKSSSSIEQNVNQVMQFYLNNINSTPVIKEVEILESYEKDLPQDLIIYAMEKAVERKQRNLAYIKGILNSWISKGITTLAEAQEEKPKVEKREDPVKQDYRVRTDNEIDYNQFYANF